MPLMMAHGYSVMWSPAASHRALPTSETPSKRHVVEALAQSYAGVTVTTTPFYRIIKMQNQLPFKLSSFLASSATP